MIEALLIRAWSDTRVTLGMLTLKGINHDPFFTLENPVRFSDKDSRIPEGRYRCVPYSGTKHKDVYEVTNVPGRKAILFHMGNFESDTEGCILLGEECGMISGSPAIKHSFESMERFKRLLCNNDFYLTIR